MSLQNISNNNTTFRTDPEVNKNESSVNPYNRALRETSQVSATAAASTTGQQQQQQQQSSSSPPSEQDYQYSSLVNTMSSPVKSNSYFKCSVESSSSSGICGRVVESSSGGGGGGGVGMANELLLSISGEGEASSVGGEWTRHESFKKIKNHVEEAVKKHKVFLLRGELPRLKEALEERGWIQKYESTRTRSLPYGCSTSLEAKSLGDVRMPDGSLNERALTYFLLRHAQPDFIWDCRNDFVEWDRGIGSAVLLNRFQKPSLYTSKVRCLRISRRFAAAEKIPHLCHVYISSSSESDAIKESRHRLALSFFLNVKLEAG
ncbi:unnamed protein product [Trichogramma brassicae]|uniref:Uncharacterized protein n=1 Tax=Trichogramma brassicae TaxID=86971 RepID=A0A6H5IAJ9_9HYME|nr:unnamed protein product [Trichogramma brassicae]